MAVDVTINILRLFSLNSNENDLTLFGVFRYRLCSNMMPEDIINIRRTYIVGKNEEQSRLSLFQLLKSMYNPMPGMSASAQWNYRFHDRQVCARGFQRALGVSETKLSNLRTQIMQGYMQPLQHGARGKQKGRTPDKVAWLHTILKQLQATSSTPVNERHDLLSTVQELWRVQFPDAAPPSQQQLSKAIRQLDSVSLSTAVPALIGTLSATSSQFPFSSTLPTLPALLPAQMTAAAAAGSSQPPQITLPLGQRFPLPSNDSDDDSDSDYTDEEEERWVKTRKRRRTD